MPTERRIRNDHPNYELRNARVRLVRKPDVCMYCGNWTPKNHWYARISETRLPVCAAHFTPDDIVVWDVGGRPRVRRQLPDLNAVAEVHK